MKKLAIILLLLFIACIFDPPIDNTGNKKRDFGKRGKPVKPDTTQVNNG